MRDNIESMNKSSYAGECNVKSISNDEVCRDVQSEDRPMMESECETEAPVPTSDVRGISINPLNSGYMVKVGCQSVAVETTERLIDMLNKYLSNPADFERKWYSKDVRNKLDNI